MIARRHFLLGLCLALSSLSLPATTVEPPDIASLISQSDYVVRAVVKSATPEWKENAGRRFISTRVELEVREIIKGAPPSPLVLDLIGGRIGDDELRIEGLPPLNVGDENVLFVYDRQRKMLPLVALMHGVYPIKREAKSGEEYVLRSNGRPLYSEQDVSLPMNQASPVKQLNPDARPLTAATFIRQLRARVAPILPTAREN